MTASTRLSSCITKEMFRSAVATIGHGLYLGYRLLQDGRVNSISFGLLVFLAAATILMILLVVLMRRAEARADDDPWYVDRG